MLCCVEFGPAIDDSYGWATVFTGEAAFQRTCVSQIVDKVSVQSKPWMTVMLHCRTITRWRDSQIFYAGLGRKFQSRL
jgi:hypothetical protein